MNCTTNVKSRKLAVVLAALFMVCTSFAILADSSSAVSADPKPIIPSDGWLSEQNAFEKCEIPATPDVTLNTGDDVAAAGTTGTAGSLRTIVVKDGANLTCGDVSFSYCNVYFEGSATVNFDKIIFSNSSVWFAGVLVNIGNVFGTTEITTSGFAVSKSVTDNGTLVSFATETSSFNVKCTTGNGVYNISAMGEADAVKFTMLCNANAAKVSILCLAISGNMHIDDVIVDADLNTKAVRTQYVTKVTSGDSTLDVDAAQVNEIKALANADPNFKLTFEVASGASITFSNAALKTLNAGTLDVKTATLTEEQKKIVGEATTVYDITFGTNTQLGGNVVVKVPYNIAGQDMSKVYVGYLDGDKVVPIPATFEDGYVVFTTNHFSLYAIMFESASPASESGNTPFYVAFAVCIVVLVAAIVLAYRKN